MLNHINIVFSQRLWNYKIWYSNVNSIKIKYAIDGVINNGTLTTNENFHHLAIAIGITLFIFLIVRPPIEYLRQYLAQWTSNKILYDIRKQLYDHLQALSARFYANNQVGQVISRVINDVEQTKTLF